MQPAWAAWAAGGMGLGGMGGMGGMLHGRHGRRGEGGMGAMQQGGGIQGGMPNPQQLLVQTEKQMLQQMGMWGGTQGGMSNLGQMMGFGQQRMGKAACRRRSSSSSNSNSRRFHRHAGLIPQRAAGLRDGGARGAPDACGSASVRRGAGSGRAGRAERRHRDHVSPHTVG